MNKHDFLPHFITDEIYPIAENQAVEEVAPSSASNDSSESDSIIEKEPIPSQQTVALKPLMIVNDEMDEQNLSLLTKVLGAVGHELSEDMVVDSLEHANGKKVICFVNDSTNNVTYYRLSNKSEREILYSKPLSILQQDVNEKKQLWEALKSWFSV